MVWGLGASRSLEALCDLSAHLARAARVVSISVRRPREPWRRSIRRGRRSDLASARTRFCQVLLLAPEPRELRIGEALANLRCREGTLNSEARAISAIRNASSADATSPADKHTQVFLQHPFQSLDAICGHTLFRSSVTALPVEQYGAPRETPSVRRCDPRFGRERCHGFRAPSRCGRQARSGASANSRPCAPRYRALVLAQTRERKCPVEIVGTGAFAELPGFPCESRARGKPYLHRPRSSYARDWPFRSIGTNTAQTLCRARALKAD